MTVHMSMPPDAHSADAAHTWQPWVRWETVLLALLGVEILFFSIVAPGFFNGFTGMLALTQNFVPAGLVALGLTVVILSGGIDLSVGSIAGLVAAIMAVCWQANVNIWVAVVIALAAGAALGALNAALVTHMQLEPLIATLATNFIYGSVATVIMGSKPPYGFPDSFTFVGTGVLLGVPSQLLLFATVSVAFILLLNHTTFGRVMVMIGANRAAARYAGVSISRALLPAYIISGTMAGLAGIILGAFYNAVHPDMGGPLLLTAITIVVLGGIDIFGGDGDVAGVVISSLILGFLTQGMLIMGYADLTTTMTTGFILIIAITLKMSSHWQGYHRLLERLLGRSPQPDLR